MKLRRIIKQKARAALTGNRGSAVALLMVCFIVSFIINMVDAAALQLLGYEFTIDSPNIFTYSDNFFYSLPAMAVSFITWLVRMALVVPLGYGILNWHLELTDRRKHGVMHIFWPYESKAAVRGILLSLNIAVKMFFASLLLLALPMGILFSGYMPGIGYALSTTLIYSGIVLTAIALLLLLAFSQRFAMAGILLCDKYQLTVHQAVKTSVDCTKGHRWELVRFELSFLPWILPLLAASVMLTFSFVFDDYSIMPLVWLWVFAITAVVTYLVLTPYYTMAQVMYARYLYEYGQWTQQSRRSVADSAENFAQPVITESAAEPVQEVQIPEEAENIEMQPEELSKNPAPEVHEAAELSVDSEQSPQ